MLLATPAFRWVWAGALVSLVGTHLQLVALPYFVYAQTGSAFATAVTAAAQALPGIALAPLAGALADGHDSRRILVVADAALAVVTLGFCAALVAPWPVVVVVAFTQASLAQLVGPAEAVLVPALVSADALPAANALLGTSNSLARLVGPAAGGLLYAVAGLPAAAVVNAVSFAAAAALVSLARPATTPLSPSAGPALTSSWKRRWMAAGWRRGWHVVRGEPLLLRLLVVFVLTGLGEGVVEALLAPFVQHVFGSSTALGVLLSCQAVGGITGALAATRWMSTAHLPRTLAWSALACGVLLAAMTGYPLLDRSLWPALVLIGVAGVPFAVVATAQVTLLQVLSPPNARGRVFGVLVAASGAAQLLGILASGYLADRTSVYLLIADAPCYLLAGVTMLRARRRRLPGPAPA